jgi:hypothetical protein
VATLTVGESRSDRGDATRVAAEEVFAEHGVSNYHLRPKPGWCAPSNADITSRLLLTHFFAEYEAGFASQR